MCPSFEIFGHAISTYWICIVVGVALAVALALLRWRVNRFHTPVTDILYIVLFGFVGGIFGAKLLEYFDYIIRDWANPGFWTIETWVRILPGTGIFYGGLIGGLAATLIYVHKYKLDFRDVTDILVPSLLLAQAFGRLGCFSAGCCHGREAAWGIAFTHSLSAPNGVPLIPVQLFESGFALLVMSAILIFRPERKRSGILLPIYLMAYATGRFFLEFFRGDIGREIGKLSSSQLISLLILLVGVIMLWSTKRRHSRYASNLLNNS